MNETINNLVNRRSVRSYQNKQIDEEALQQILQAGLYAPSGMGRQPTIMVVIQDEATIKKRLDAVKIELERAEKFDYRVVNDDLDRAVKELEEIIIGEQKC